MQKYRQQLKTLVKILGAADENHGLRNLSDIQTKQNC